MDLSNFLFDIETYFYSYYLNSTTELIIFVVLIFSTFMFFHIRSYFEIKSYRESIPLSVGGWGTRGKSGTERIKAALFHGDGWETFSKTTGCEAMFVHSVPRLKLSEIFLYRPYDKATIWEQRTVLKIASKTNADVFLWECMALTPDYVNILQHEWVRDDYTTLTNAHPDHEDIQGPSGFNVATVISDFIPFGKRTITAEEQMFPLLTEVADRKKTEIDQIDWKDPLKVSDDLLERFPYEEHPLNISMILMMAKELGVDEDLALRVMADDVVPDLGVLKVYPQLTCMDRDLEFTNGMSANERFAALGNWSRMGFKDQGIDDFKRSKIVVVNNRADRVPRSQVFARLCAEAMEASHYYIIGTNIDGFMTYVRDSYDVFFENSFLSDGVKSGQATPEFIKKLSNYLSVHPSVSAFSEFIKSSFGEKVSDDCLQRAKQGDIEVLISAVSGLEIDLNESLTDLIRSDFERVKAFEEIVSNLSAADVKEKIWKVFEKRFHPIFDSYASANFINEEICKHTYPNVLNRIIGVQNIKGTGLGFAYSWEDWYEIYPEIEGLFNPKSLKSKEHAYKFLSNYKTKNIIVIHGIIKGLKAHNQNDEAKNLQDKFSSYLVADDSDQVQLPKWMESLIGILEQIFDPGDSVWRRKRSDYIYRLLSRGLVTHAVAKTHLQSIVYRQKGGWLKKRIVSQFFKRSHKKG